MEKFSAESANKVLYETLANEVESIVKKAERISASDVSEGIKVIDPDLGIRILESDEEKYNALIRLQEILKFKDAPANKLYEIPGMTINGTTINLVVHRDNIGKIADMGKYFERELSFLGVKFPAQLYQFKKEYKGQNLPGKDYPAPEPKTMEMTEADYEKYLEQYYKSHGTAKEEDEASYRKPYPHEKIDYKTANAEKDGYTNEYYQAQLKKHAEGKGTTKKAEVGKKIKVTATSVKRPNIFNAKDQVEGTQKWQKIESFVIKAAGIAAGVAGIGFLVSYNPGLLVLGAGAGAFALVRYIKKRHDRNVRRKLIEEQEEYERKKKEAEEAEKKAKEKEKEKEHEAPEGPVVEPTTTPGPVKPEPKKTPEPKGGKGGGTKEPKPSKPKNPTTRTPKDSPSGSSSTVDLDALALAEQELGMDQAEFTRINSEINAIVIEVQELLRSTNPADKERLIELQAQLGMKYQERMQIIYILMQRQDRMFDDIGVKFSR